MCSVKFVDHNTVIFKETIVGLINYVCGVECSHEFLINNFINFFIINHRRKKEKKMTRKKVYQLLRHVANTKFVLDSMYE